MVQIEVMACQKKKLGLLKKELSRGAQKNVSDYSLGAFFQKFVQGRLRYFGWTLIF
jgi:hypothetical protein